MSNKNVPLADVQRVIEACPEPWRKLFHTMLYTGARYMEIATLTPEQVGMDSIKIEPHTLPDGSLWRPKRPASVRSIVISHEFAASLYASAQPGQLIFFPNKERPTNARTANYFLEKFCKKLGVRYFSTHQMRRVRITQALEAGANPHSVRAAVGHRSLMTTIKYMDDVPVRGELPNVDAEPVDDPVCAQYMFLTRRKNW